MSGHEDTVSVVVCTRDRAASLRTSLVSVAAARRYACETGQVRCVEVLVVDQSRDRASAEVLAELPAAPPRHLWACGVTGLAVARNLGLRDAVGDLILFTDDDCEVAVDWIVAWYQAMTQNPRARLGFGEVLGGPRPAAVGENATLATFAAGTAGTFGLELFRRGPAAIGIGANLALRAPLPPPLAGFDEAFGAGATFPGAEEFDLAYRAARGGELILHVPAAVVVHHGWRDGDGARRLTGGYQLGIGAMWGKHVRAGDSLALGLLVRWALALVTKVLRRRGRRPTGIRDLLAYARGALRGSGRAADPTSRCLRPPGSSCLHMPSADALTPSGGPASSHRDVPSTDVMHHGAGRRPGLG